MHKYQTYAGVITQVPRVGKSFIIGKIKIEGEELPLVAFNNLPNKVKAAILAAQPNQSVQVMGRIDTQASMGKRLIAEKFLDAEDLQYTIDPDVDFTPGGMSSFNNKLITMSEPREGRKQYFTDGDYYWYKDSEAKAPWVF